MLIIHIKINSIFIFLIYFIILAMLATLSYSLLKHMLKNLISYFYLIFHPLNSIKLQFLQCKINFKKKCIFKSSQNG